MSDRSASIAPFSLRLSRAERARLEREAAGQPLGAYIRSRLLDSETLAPRQRGKFPVKDHQALSAVLGKLGSSHIASNLNQLAKAANSGSLALTPDVLTNLQQACENVAAIRRLLIEALGLDGGGS